MRGKRTFLKDNALQAAPVIFEQFCRAEIARNQDRIARQALLRSGSQLTGHDPQEPVRQILHVVHPVSQQRIVNLAHAHAGALLDTFDRSFSGKPAVDRFIDPAAPAFVIGEHLVGRDDLFMLAANAEFSLIGHIVDLLAHLVERAINPLALGFDIVCHNLIDGDARLVIDRLAKRKPFDQREASNRLRAGLLC